MEKYKAFNKKGADNIKILYKLGWTDELEKAFAEYRKKGYVPGRVGMESKGIYKIYTESGMDMGQLSGKLHYIEEEGRFHPAAGDWAAVEEMTREKRAVIHAILPRKSSVVRKSAGVVTREQVVAVNVDTVFIVMSLNQNFNLIRLERYLVMVWESNLGKDELKTREVSSIGDKGRHTTTARELVLLPDGGVLIDTPGMRELQLWDGEEGSIADVFTDIEELAKSCRFKDCSHNNEPGCAVLDAIRNGNLERQRLDSYRKLQKELRFMEQKKKNMERIKNKRSKGKYNKKSADYMDI